MLAGRRPRHPVGWLLLAFGLCLSTATIVAAIACNGFILLLTPAGGPVRASFWILLRPYQEAKTRAWPPEPSS